MVLLYPTVVRVGYVPFPYLRDTLVAFRFAAARFAVCCWFGLVSVYRFISGCGLTLTTAHHALAPTPRSRATVQTHYPRDTLYIRCVPRCHRVYIYGLPGLDMRWAATSAHDNGAFAFVGLPHPDFLPRAQPHCGYRHTGRAGLTLTTVSRMVLDLPYAFICLA